MVSVMNLYQHDKNLTILLYLKTISQKTHSLSNGAEEGSFSQIFCLNRPYLCQVEGHGGTLANIYSENCQKFPSAVLKNILYFDIPMYPSFICHTKFGLSPHGLDFGVFGPL